MSVEDSLYRMLPFYERSPAFIRNAVGMLYRQLPKRFRYGSAYTSFTKELRKSANWDAKKIEEYQVRAIRESLIAASKSSYYASRFIALGVKVDEFESLKQLQLYPLLTKLDILANREKMVNRDAGVHKRLYMTTGGSTGQPLGFYLHKGVSRPKEQAFLEAQWARFSYRPDAKVAMVRGAVTNSGSKGKISSYDATRNWLILSSYHLTAERIPEYVKALNSFQPEFLHAYPSSALMLARGIEQSGLKMTWKPKALLCGSEKLAGDLQYYLQGFFKAPVCHWYGHSERVVLAGQTGKSQLLHPWPTYGYMEFGEKDEEGMCEIIGTSFHNQIMPLIRYCTGDRARVEHTAQGPIIHEIAGREHEFLVSKIGRRISLTAINMHDSIFDGLMAVQFYQERLGAVELRYQAGPQWHSSREDSIRAGLHRKLGDDFSLELCACSELEKTRAGKHKWLISYLSKAA